MSGLFEGYLSKKRASVANQHILEDHRGGSILDIGCGEKAHFLSTIEFEKKYGIERRKSDITLPLDITVQQLDLERDPHLLFANDSFDVITMLATFEHFEKGILDSVVKEVYRVLKPKGRFILTTPPPWSDPILKIMAVLRLVDPKQINEHKGAYSHRAISTYLVKAGFSINQIQAGYFHCFLNSWCYADK